MMRGVCWGAALALLPGLALACDPAPEPVVTLDYGSRYQADDPARAAIDRESDRAVTEALRPMDDFVRDLVRQSNRALREGDIAEADCVVAQIATWADADALSRLDSFNANLSVGGRLVGLAEAYRQVRSMAQDAGAKQRIEGWLSQRASEQIDFWEKDATTGARRGNLRAWATLAVLLTGDLTGDDFARFWAYASATRILCTASEDGSLPQEMRRGKWALHYQFHAIAPLVLIAAHAERSGPSLVPVCDGALLRIVGFALDDYEAGGAASSGYSGQPQSYFDGTKPLEDFAIAWLPAYLALVDDAQAQAWSDRVDRLYNSKLGGDQRLIWGPPPG